MQLQNNLTARNKEQKLQQDNEKLMREAENRKLKQKVAAKREIQKAFKPQSNRNLLTARQTDEQLLIGGKLIDDSKVKPLIKDARKETFIKKHSPKKK